MEQFFKRYRGRTFKFGETVEVYWNLNVENAFSIRCAANKLVSAHCSSVTLTNCEFIVGEAGRQSAIRKEKQEVHTFVRGKVVSVNQSCPSELDQVVSYEPYKHGFLFREGTSTPVNSASSVHCEANYCHVSASEQDLLEDL
ncbi:hypothetical protein MKZ20_21540 [Psychrobacillus sp. FSL K6-2684]|uniref:hypothetical protein n=1 Tax=unclassified Psychrobacillus TaxID=2636677 RepID=UPI0030FCA75D